jgi:hypothetical protein
MDTVTNVPDTAMTDAIREKLTEAIGGLERIGQGSDFPTRYTLTLQQSIEAIRRGSELLNTIDASRVSAFASIDVQRRELDDLRPRVVMLDRRDGFARAIAASVLSLLQHGDAHNAQQLAQTWLDSLPERS